MPNDNNTPVLLMEKTHMKKFKTKIAIKLPFRKWKDAHEWGDYHMSLALKKEFEKKGCDVIIQTYNEWYNGEDDNCDVVIVLRGLSRYSPNKKHFNIMWNISHPDMVEIEEYNQYDHVFISSKIWADVIKEKASVPVDCLLQCTDTELFYHDFEEKYLHEILFVGNSRKVFRKIIKDLLPTDKDLSIYGNNWEPFVDEKYIFGRHIPNNELRKAYSSCDILLNDHWDDMREKGFISNRLFDGFASGAFIISDKISGASELFEDALVTYETPEELKNLVDKYTKNNNARINKALKAQKIVMRHHTFRNRVEDMLKVINSKISNKIHFQNSDLTPEVYMDQLWNTMIHPIIHNIQTKNMLMIGSDMSLTENILEYCKCNHAHLNLITQSQNMILDLYKNENCDHLEILNETSLITTPKLEEYDTLFLDGSKDLHTIHSEISTIERKFKNKDFPIIFMYDVNRPGIETNITLEPDSNKRHLDYLTNIIEDYTTESELNLSYLVNEAYNGLLIIFPKYKSKEQIIKNTFNNAKLLKSVEEERQKFSIAYSESKCLIDSLETKILEDKINHEIEEDDVKQLTLRLEKQADASKKLLKENQFLNKEKQALNKDITERKGQYNLLLDSVSNNIVEMEYDNGKNRSMLQKISSRIPSLLILFNRRNAGFKNALINIKGYKAIKKNNMLDTGYYLNNYKDVRVSGKDPIIHYLYHGYKEGRRPNPDFDGEYYLKKHPDVRKSNLNPLVHYALYGMADGRKTQESSKKSRHLKFNPQQKGVSDGSPALKNIRGALFSNGNNPIIKGWIAKIGDNKPRTAILKIDNNEEYEVLCNTFRSDLKNNKINEGNHSFEFNVPADYINENKHNLQLFDKDSGKLIDQKIKTWSNQRFYKDFGGFLVDSIINTSISAPFCEEDKRCFGVMENVANHLTDLATDQDDKPLISVIMPVYNRVGIVKSAVDSVLKQTYPNIELIIVDDGSNDGTFELLKKLNDERIVLLHNESCQGVSNARNKGLEVANGKYIAYLDSDNLWDNRYVAAMIGAFLKLPDAEAIYSGQLLFKGDNEDPFAVRFASLNKSLLSNTNFIDMNAFCHTKNIYKRLGGFDTSLKRLVDYDLILRYSEDAKMYSIPVLLSYYYFDVTENAISKTEDYNEALELTRNKQKLRREAKLLSKSSNTLDHKVSIVIPSFESYEYIQDCINSILTLNLKDWLEIIVVDNGSSQDVVDYLSGLESEGKIKLLLNDINYGFTFAVNQGINLAESGNDILILNNDALITPGAVEALQRAAYKLEKCGITVPQQVLPGGTKTISIHVPSAKSEFDCDVNLSLHHANIKNVPIFHDGEVVELNFAPFFCVYIKRDVLDNSTGLDARLGRHYRSDRMFCDYIQNYMGLKIYYVSEAVVFHKLQQSTEILLKEQDKEDFNTMLQENKWDPELADKLGFKNAKWDI